jgi:hypothetical protein
MINPVSVKAARAIVAAFFIGRAGEGGLAFILLKNP